MVLFGEDLPLAKKALSATPSRRDQLLLVECDRSPCGNNAATKAMEQQDWEAAMLIPSGWRLKVCHQVWGPTHWHCHVNRKFAGQMNMATMVYAAIVAWRQVSIA